MAFSFFASKEQSAFKKQLRNILGFSPSNLAFYTAALTHSSVHHGKKNMPNNERMEFLGDAFLGSIVGTYLFKKYPKEDEGFLTELRSKIVSRKMLGSMALKLGLDKLMHYDRSIGQLRFGHIFGNALEALIGAIFLDKGYTKTESFVMKVLIGQMINVQELADTEINFKRGLYTWAQRERKQISFQLLDQNNAGPRRTFQVGVFVDEEQIEEATGWSKKEAEQAAAEKALKSLGIEEEN